MNTLKTTMSKIAQIEQPERTDLAKHNVELGLIDDLKKEADKVSKQIGFVNKDIIEVKKAIQRIGMIKVDLASTDELANNLLKAVVNFENKANDLGLDIPKEVINYGNISRELLKSNNELRKIINEI